MPQPPTGNTNLLTSLIPYIAGFISAVVAEPIKRKIFKPVLELDFKNNQDFKTRTPEYTTMGESEAVYIRVGVRNKSWFTALGCRAHLVNIEIKNKEGRFERTEFVDTLRLAWSCQPPSENAFRPIDIPKNVNQFADVFSTRPSFRMRTNTLTFRESLSPGNFASTFRFETQLMPLRYEKLAGTEGEYRYTILVTADGVDPKFIKLIFKWSKDWENFEVEKV